MSIHIKIVKKPNKNQQILRFAHNIDDLLKITGLNDNIFVMKTEVTRQLNRGLRKSLGTNFISYFSSI